MTTLVSDSRSKNISKTVTGYSCLKISKTGEKRQKLLKFRHTGAKRM